MPSNAVTLNLPDSLYVRFEEEARAAHTTVEAQLLQIVQAAARDEGGLPEDLAQAVRDLEVLDDKALWNAARAQLPEEAHEHFDALNFKQQSEGLTPRERAEQKRLLHQSDRMMLVRAHAARLLRERGHDVSSLL